MVAVGVCRDDSCPEKFGESAFLDMRIKEAGLSVKEMLCTEKGQAQKGVRRKPESP